MTVSATARFPGGATAIRRDTFDGGVWTASPHRVLHDSGHELALAYWPGIQSFAPTTWIDWLRTGDPTAREAAITSLAARRWDLGHWTWRETTWLSILTPESFFSVNLFFDHDHRLNRWYVNFQRPYARTSIGVDTFDLFLDLVVAPDLSSYTWKDEDEYRHGRRLGIVDDGTHQHVQRAREEAVAMIEGRRGAFGAPWADWRADASWPVPVLPVDAMTVPAGL
ncbi:DUF402 domain-containing protein [Streptosporangium canum]|uniref:DUF402 domain-containing protein n=1 Tax=Streptosporangium canum TaxID=324952 RepID=UPI00368F2E27